uniref:Uncharacterized protein n=1 Tax=Arundo donax TaxID=35708 RepID=A0A0A8ZJJ3_ARUDO
MAYRLIAGSFNTSNLLVHRLQKVSGEKYRDID